MRQILFLFALAVVPAAMAQVPAAQIDPGMTRTQVIERLGSPATERSSGAKATHHVAPGPAAGAMVRRMRRVAKSHTDTEPPRVPAANDVPSDEYATVPATPPSVSSSACRAPCIWSSR